MRRNRARRLLAAVLVMGMVLTQAIVWSPGNVHADAGSAPISHWSMNDASVSGAVLADDGGGGNVGAITNALSGPGVAGEARVFDGAGDYIRIPHHASLEAASFTVSAWFKPDDIDNKTKYIAAKNGWEGLDGFFGFYQYGTTVRAYVKPSTSSAVQLNSGNDKVAAGAWHHAVLTYDGVTRSMKLYVNGAQVGSTTTPQARAVSGTGDLILGNRPDNVNGSGYAFKGSIDETSFYNVALSGAEVAALYEEMQEPAAPASSTYYVAPDGSDSNPGTLEEPFATLKKARDVVRTVNDDMEEDIHVIVRGGTYRVSETLVFTDADSGSNGYTVHYEAYEGETPVISGGQKVAGTWSAVAGKPYSKVTLPSSVAEFRQLYVDGERRQRAKTEFMIKGSGWSYDGSNNRNGFLIDNDMLGPLTKPQYAQVGQHSAWRHYIVSVQSAQPVPGDRTALVFKQPHFNAALQNSPLDKTPTFNNEFHVENDLTLLDKPGEWYYDRDTKELFYYPMPGENLASIDAEVPLVQTIMQVKGSNLANKARDIAFSGLTFRHSAWNATSEQGFVSNQTDFILRPEGPANSPLTNHPPAGVQVDAAEYITFERNRFEHMGAIGFAIHFANHITANGNIVADTSGTGITIGTQSGSVINGAWEEVPKFNTLTNNVVKGTGVEYEGSPGMQIYFTQDTLIAHNDVSETGLGGINISSWTPDIPGNPTRRNHILNNKVYDFMTRTMDNGGIYTWSVLGDGTEANDSVIANNYIKGGFNEYGSIYLDETSRHVRVHDNVIENPYSNWLYLWKNTIQNVTVTDNYATSAEIVNKAANSVVEDAIIFDPSNKPAAVLAIIAGAGLEAEYADLLSGFPASPTNQAPVVHAGSNQTIALNENVQLNVTVSDDGLPKHVALRPFWEKVSGPGDVTFHYRTGVKSTAAFSQPGTYVLRLTVSDGELASSSTLTVNVTAAALPANVALNKPVTVSDTYPDATNPTLYTPAKAVDGNIETGWVPYYLANRFLSVDLGAKYDINRIEFVARQEACCSSGGNWLQQSNDFYIAASNDPTFSDKSQVVFLGNIGSAVTKIGMDAKATGVFNVDNNEGYRYVRVAKDPDGSYFFISELRVFGELYVNNGDATLGSLTASQGQLQPAFQSSMENYTVKVDVNTTSINLTAAPSNIGASMTINGAPVTSGASGPHTLATGNNVFTIAVTAPDTTVKNYTVTVVRSVAATPAVNAGPDLTVGLLGNAQLNGSGNTSTGQTTAALWEKVSGPGSVTFGSVSAFATTAAFSAPGDYVLRLRGDNGEFSATDTVSVTVQPAVLPPNLALNKPVTVSNYVDNHPVHSPSHAVDGNIATAWAGNWVGGHPIRLGVDLGAEYAIGRVELVFHQTNNYAGERRNFRIEASNDPTFAVKTVLAEQGTDSMPHQSTWTANLNNSNAYRYIRVIASDDFWGRGIAELRVFEAEDEGGGSGEPAELGHTLTGPAAVNGGREFVLRVGVVHVTDSVYAHELLVTYDPEVLEFVDAISVKDGYSIAGIDDTVAGVVKVWGAVQGADYAITGNAELLELTMSAKQTAGNTVIAASSILVDGELTETEADEEQLSVQVTLANRSALGALIATAEGTLAAATEGTGAGQYPVGSKAVLQAAIGIADGVLTADYVEQAQLDAAVTALQQALAQFQGQAFTAAPEDLNRDGKVSVADLAYLAVVYGKTSADAGWNAISHGDLNGDGVIDIFDMYIVASRLVAP